MKSKIIIFLFFQFTCISIVNGQVKKSSNGIDFPCPVEDIEISYFEDKNQSQDEGYITRHYKVVIDRIFKFKAVPESSSANWVWKLGVANGDRTDVADFWDFQILPPTNGILARKGDGKISINKLPLNNSDLGPKNGDIKATATINGDIKTKISTVSANISEDQVVDIFFKKDQIHPVTVVPNWFQYWSQATPIVDKLTIPGIKLWDTNLCIFKDAVPIQMKLVFGDMPYSEGSNVDIVYARNKFNHTRFDNEDTFNPNQSHQCYYTGSSRRFAVGYENGADNIVIGNGCGHKMYTQAPAPAPSIITGIHVLYSNVVHEVEHALIVCEIWANGYDSSLDEPIPIGISDGYRDEWETETNALNVDVLGYCPFTIGVDDKYNDNYNSNDVGNCAASSAGTNYEEKRCRQKQLELIPLLNNVNSFDWSFDPSENILEKEQGKQW